MQRIPRGYIITALILLLVGFVAWYGALQYSRSGLDKIEVVALPPDSTITIDDKPAKNGANYVEPGKHTITASREYFDPVTATIDTSKQGDEPVYLLPSANSEEAIDWLADHPDVQQQIEGVVSGLEAERQAEITKNNPIIDKLPAYTDHYRIDYSFNQEEKLDFQITLYAIINSPSQYASYKAQLQQYRDEALQFLTDNGVDVNTSFITYTPDDF